MESNIIYDFIQKNVSFLLPGVEFVVYELADLSMYNRKFIVVINNEFKFDIVVNRYKLLSYSEQEFESIYDTINNEIDFYKNRFLKIRKIKNIINEKTL